MAHGLLPATLSCGIAAAYNDILQGDHWHQYFVFHNSTWAYFLTQNESGSHTHNFGNLMLKIDSTEF